MAHDNEKLGCGGAWEIVQYEIRGLDAARGVSGYRAWASVAGNGRMRGAYGPFDRTV
jgi:hypothetical protein